MNLRRNSFAVSTAPTALSYLTFRNIFGQILNIKIKITNRLSEALVALENYLNYPRDHIQMFCHGVELSDINKSFQDLKVKSNAIIIVRVSPKHLKIKDNITFNDIIYNDDYSQRNNSSVISGFHGYNNSSSSTVISTLSRGSSDTSSVSFRFGDVTTRKHPDGCVVSFIRRTSSAEFSNATNSTKPSIVIDSKPHNDESIQKEESKKKVREKLMEYGYKIGDNNKAINDNNKDCTDAKKSSAYIKNHITGDPFYNIPEHDVKRIKMFANHLKVPESELIEKYRSSGGNVQVLNELVNNRKK